MADTIKIAMQDSLLEHIAGLLLQAGGRDLSGFVVVFPGDRPCLYLRELLNRRISGPYHPPHLLSIDALITLLSQQYAGGARHDVESLELLHGLWQVVRAVSEGVETRDVMKEVVKDFETFFFWGMELLQVLNEFESEDFTPDFIDRYVNLALEADGLSPEAAGVWPFLGRIYEEWLNLLQERSWWTRGERYRLASKLEQVDWSFLLRSNAGGTPVIYLAGFLLPSTDPDAYQSRTEQKIFDLLVNRHDATCITYDRSISRQPEVKVYEAVNFHGQLAMAGRILHEKNVEKDQVSHELRAFVLPSPDRLIPALCWLMNAQPAPFNVTMGYPMERLPLTELVFSVLALVQSSIWSAENAGGISMGNLLYLPDLICLLSHPYLLAYERSLLREPESTTGSVLEAWMQEKRMSFGDPQELREALAAASMDDSFFEAVLRVARETASSSTVEGRALCLIGFIKGLSQADVMLQDVMRGAFWQDGNRVLMELLQALARSPLRQEEMSAAGFKRLLRYLMAERRLPFKGIPLEGLQVLGILETRCLNFDEVFIFDLNEGVLPSGIRPNAILPFSLRRAMKLSNVNNTIRIERHHLLRLMAGASRIHLFYSASQQSERSRFLEEIIWEREKQAKKILEDGIVCRQHLHVRPVELGRGIASKSDAVLKKLQTIVYSASSINTYLKCPYRFYVKYCLGIPDDRKRYEIDGAVIGNILHGTLYDMYSPFVQQPINNDMLEQIGNSIDSYLIKNIEKILMEQERWSVQIKLLKEIMKYRIEGFMKFEKNNNSGMYIKALETTKEKQLTLKNGCSIRIKGRIDRIHIKDDETWIVDYKTGNDVKSISKYIDITLFDRESLKNNVVSFQLPIYLWLCDESNTYSQINAAYYRLKGLTANTGDSSPEIRFFDEDGEMQPAIMKEFFLPALDAIFCELLSQDTQFTPDFSDADYCGYCAYAHTVCKAV
jgi:hypothetical protein